jgi:hypothetical protein
VRLELAPCKKIECLLQGQKTDHLYHVKERWVLCMREEEDI